MRSRVRAVLIGVALGVQASAAAAQAEATPAASAAHGRGVYSLAHCLRLAERNYPKVHEAKARLKHKRAQLWQAQTAPYSEFTMTGGIGVAPVVHGTNVYSRNTDVALTSSMALAWQVGVEGAVPLWTFGKISNLWDAADAQVAVGQHEVKKEKNELRLNVRKAFYGAQLARDSLNLVREAMSRIDK